jgi:DNA-binding XRE family transcriptional regulator
MKFSLEKLKVKRKSLGLKHRHCAKAIGKSAATYARKESGKFPLTSWEIDQIAKLFYCRQSEFYDLEKEAIYNKLKNTKEPVIKSPEIFYNLDPIKKHVREVIKENIFLKEKIKELEGKISSWITTGQGWGGEEIEK